MRICSEQTSVFIPVPPKSMRPQCRELLKSENENAEECGMWSGECGGMAECDHLTTRLVQVLDFPSGGSDNIRDSNTLELLEVRISGFSCHVRIPGFIQDKMRVLAMYNIMLHPETYRTPELGFLYSDFRISGFPDRVPSSEFFEFGKLI